MERRRLRHLSPLVKGGWPACRPGGFPGSWTGVSGMHGPAKGNVSGEAGLGQPLKSAFIGSA